MSESPLSKNINPDLLAKLQAYEEPCLEIFTASDYFGRSQKLPTRQAKYSAADLAGPDGIGINTLSSLRFDSSKVPGRVYSVVLYAEDGCRGESKTFSESSTWVGDNFRNRTKSIAINLWQE
jgi:hypothetical protein